MMNRNKCDYCKKLLTYEQDYPWQFGHHFCSAECYDKYLKWQRKREKGKNEFFTAATKKDVYKKMDDRLSQLEKKNHVLLRRKKIGRNDPCPCGSGKKFKKCCLQSIQLPSEK